jgi:hypothetical protein
MHENGLDNTVKKLKTSLIKEILKSYLIRKFFGKPKTKHTIIESKEGKTFIEDEEIADRWQQYIEELHNDSEELEELEREEDITPEELGLTINNKGKL